MKTSDILWQDSQHQGLIEIIERLERDNAGCEVFDELKRYTREHFGMEERYMDAYQFPDTEKHKEEHIRFEERLDAMTRSRTLLEQSLRDPRCKLRLVEFLRGWLMGHIFGIDKDLEAFLLQIEYDQVG